MTLGRSASRVALAALLSLTVLIASPVTRAQVSEDARLSAIARAGETRASDRIVAPNPEYQPVVDRQHRERIAATLSATAIAIISLEPARRAEVERAARAAAPEVADEVSRRIARAFPGAAAPIGAAPPVRFTHPPAHGITPAHLATPRQGGGRESLASLEAWLVGAIAGDPDRLEDAVQTAVASRPGDRAALVATASEAFPGFAPRIAAAAAGAPGPRFAETAAPAPTVVPASAPAPKVVARGGPTPVVYLADSAEATGSPAAPSRPGVAPEEAWDPLEPINRIIFAVNDAVDFLVLRPVAWVYNKVVPDPVILAVRRFFDNLESPVIVANDLLQLEFEDAAVAAARFGVNTTAGVLGFFDVASELGLPAHHADFGQTLHSYGVGPGPYVVLPLFGPSTARDGTGSIVDIFLDPTTYVIPRPESFALTGSKAISIREELLVPLDELKASSIDYYAAVRGAYYQVRAVELSKQVGGKASVQTSSEETDKLFDEAN